MHKKIKKGGIKTGRTKELLQNANDRADSFDLIKNTLSSSRILAREILETKTRILHGKTSIGSLTKGKTLEF